MRGKHPALISQKLLLTVYKMSVTKSCKKQDQAKQQPLGRAQGTGRLRNWPWGTAGTGTWGAHLHSCSLGHTCSPLSIYKPRKTAPEGHKHPRPRHGQK